MKDIINDKIAYIKINSMINYDYSKSDQKLIKKYLKKIKNYPALVIDIRGNSGGDSRYRTDFLLPSIIDNSYKVNYYNFIKYGPLNKKVISQEKYKTGVDEFLKSHDFDSETKDILNKFDYYNEYYLLVNKAEDSINYKGNIYLLVDGGVYSSSEMMVLFCKNAKIATVIGSKTGGDGIGTDPMQTYLPNSGFVLRYSKEIGVTEDGSINELDQTKPDIQLDSNPLDDLDKQEIIQKIIEIETSKN